MKKHANTILLLFCLAFSLVAQFRISSLDGQLRSLRAQLSSQYSGLTSQVSGISNAVTDELRRQASIIASFDYSFGGFDPASLSVPLTLRFTPKEQKADTVVAFQVGESLVEAENQDGLFAATLPVSVFNSLEASVSVTTDGLQKREALPVYENPRDTFLLNIYGTGLSGARGYSDGAYQWEGDFMYELSQNGSRASQAVSAALVAEVDGREIWRQEVASDAAGSSAEVNQSFAVGSGQELLVWFDVTDSLGLRYRSLVDVCRIDEAGQWDRRSPDLPIGRQDIYNADGELVYSDSAALTR